MGVGLDEVFDLIGALLGKEGLVARVAVQVGRDLLGGGVWGSGGQLRDGSKVVGRVMLGGGHIGATRKNLSKKSFKIVTCTSCKSLKASNLRYVIESAK